jgi:hypothetical protein
MDRTGHVDGPYKRLKIARQAETVRAEPLTDHIASSSPIRPGRSR